MSGNVVCDIAISVDNDRRRRLAPARGLTDELRTHFAPITLGGGERLFDGMERLHLELLSARGTSLITHVDYRPETDRQRA